MALINQGFDELFKRSWDAYLSQVIYKNTRIHIVKCPRNIEKDRYRRGTIQEACPHRSCEGGYVIIAGPKGSKVGLR